MNKIKLITLLFFCYGGIYAQQESLTLSLNEAKEYAIQHNKTLINANKDILLADEQVKITRGNGLPQVNATLDYMTNFNYEFALSFGATSSSPTIDYSLLDAGDYEILNLLNQMSGSSEDSKIVMEDQASANLQVTQLIFSAQYWIGLKIAKLSKEIAEKNLLSSEIGVKETVGNLYYAILASQESLKILDNMIQNNQDILKRTTDMYEKGLAEEIDVDQFKMVISQLKNTKKSLERSIEYTFNTLRFVLGLETNIEIQLTDDINTFTENIVNENNHFLGLDISNNPTFQILETQEKIGKNSVSLQKWAYSPTISGYYAYKEKLLTTGFDLSPKNTAGLTLSLPILSGGTRHAQLNKAKIELDKISRNKSLLEEQLNLQERQLNFELRNALDNYTTQKENVDIAKRVYENINNKYKQGFVSSLDLTQANNNYLQAQNNYITAKLNLLLAKLNLDKLHNTL